MADFVKYSNLSLGFQGEISFELNLVSDCNRVPRVFEITIIYSVTRFGNLFDFEQLFKEFGSNYFTQISHILRQFL